MPENFSQVLAEFRNVLAEGVGRYRDATWTLPLGRVLAQSSDAEIKMALSYLYQHNPSAFAYFVILQNPRLTVRFASLWEELDGLSGTERLYYTQTVNSRGLWVGGIDAHLKNPSRKSWVEIIKARPTYSKLTASAEDAILRDFFKEELVAEGVRASTRYVGLQRYALSGPEIQKLNTMNPESQIRLSDTAELREYDALFKASGRTSNPLVFGYGWDVPLCEQDLALFIEGAPYLASRAGLSVTQEDS